MSQKQFANINNFQCQERSRWEDAQGLERSLAVLLSLQGLPSAPPTPARRGGQNKKNKAGNGHKDARFRSSSEGGILLARLFSPHPPPYLLGVRGKDMVPSLHVEQPRLLPPTCTSP